MSASGLSAEAWIVIGTLIGVTVLVCLSFIANVLDYEKSFRRLVQQVRALRANLMGRDADQPKQIRQAEPMGREWDAKFAGMRREQKPVRPDRAPKRPRGRRAA